MLGAFSECVHIIPLGHEFDRAVRPFDTTSVKRVYLVVDNGEGSSGGQSNRDKLMDGIQKEMYTPRVAEYLRGKCIDVRIVETETFNLEKLLMTLTSLIRCEKELGNEVYMNMSSSGRLVAVGAFLASVAYDIPTYYVHSERFADGKDERLEHGVSICNNGKISFLPNFRFELPTEAESFILEKLYSMKQGNAKYKDNDAAWASSMDIVSYLEEKEVGGFMMKMCNDGEVPDTRKENSRRLMRLALIMEKLSQRDGYVTVKREGRKTLYSITELGEHAFCLCGMDKDVVMHFCNSSA